MTTKIKLKTNNTDLGIVNEIVDARLFQTTIPSPEIKAMESILFELSEKLMKKAITERRNFQPFSISLKYHYGFTLHSILREWLKDGSDNSYTQNAVMKLANEIHQQL